MPPPKPANSARRPREYLYVDEITALLEGAKKSRNPQRDSTLIMLAFGHALIPVEISSLQWQHVNFAEIYGETKVTPTLTLYRNKRPGKNKPEFIPDIHLLSKAEVKALRELAASYRGATILFPSERRHRLSVRSLHNIVFQAGQSAGLDFPVHPYMLRHSGAIYRAALLLRKIPNVTEQECYLTWQKYGEFTCLSGQDRLEFQAISMYRVNRIRAVFNKMSSFLGINSINLTAKIVLQVFEAYPDWERLPQDFWLQPARLSVCT